MKLYNEYFEMLFFIKDIFRKKIRINYEGSSNLESSIIEAWFCDIPSGKEWRILGFVSVGFSRHTCIKTLNSCKSKFLCSDLNALYGTSLAHMYLNTRFNVGLYGF